jgi:AcrR family transcriptional regulator
MTRTAKYTSEQFIDAALELVVEFGPAGVTIAALAEKLRAPVGSVYHRFPSRDHILATLWLRTVEAFQAGFIDALKRKDGLAAALYTPRWARGCLNEARLLLLYRRDEFVSGSWPSDIESHATRLKRELDAAIAEFTRDIFGSVTEENMLRIVFALIDVPYASVRRSLRAGKTPPFEVDELVSETYNALIGRFK